MSRSFNPWETNHLRKHGFIDINPQQIGTTPVEYITGHAEFRHLDFIVSPHCLIPRIESEKIIDFCLEYISNYLPQNHIFTIADVGCGSGALGISLAHELNQKNNSNFRLLLSDISPSALSIARQNADSIIPSSKTNITFLESNLLENYPKNIQVDCLIANLPYIPTSRLHTLDSSVTDHEPIQALDGGPQGSTLINALLHQSQKYMCQQSFQVFEIDHTHQLSNFDLSASSHAEIKLDDFNQNRYLVIRK